MNNDLEVAHPQSGPSSTWFLVELEFGNVGFFRRGENRSTSRSKGENQQQTQPTFGVDAGIWTPGNIGGRRALSPLGHPFPW